MSFLYYIELFGVAVFAVSGALAAGRKSLDWLGVSVIAVVTAIGGGTLRDLLLDNRPFFWIREPMPLYVVLISTVFTLIYVRFHQPPIKAILVADAFGLGLFTISGAQIAERGGHSGIVIVLMGAITGAAGGMLRDVLLAEIPLVLRRSSLYATASIAGVIIYLASEYLGWHNSTCAIIGMSVIVLLRLASIYWGLTLPVFHFHHPDDDKVS